MRQKCPTMVTFGARMAFSFWYSSHRQFLRYKAVPVKNPASDFKPPSGEHITSSCSNVTQVKLKSSCFNKRRISHETS